jgi:hypothetical protein
MRRRKTGTYTRLIPIIEWLYIRGVPISRIAYELGLNSHSLSSRMDIWGVSVDRDFYRDELVAEAREKFAELLQEDQETDTDGRFS